MNKRREGQSTVVVRLRENAALEKPRKQQNGDYHQDDYHQYVNQVVRTHVCISSLGSVCIRCTAASMVRDNHWRNSQNSLYTRSPPEKPIAPLRFGPGATVWWRTSGGIIGKKCGLRRRGLQGRWTGAMLQGEPRATRGRTLCNASRELRANSCSRRALPGPLQTPRPSPARASRRLSARPHPSDTGGIVWQLPSRLQ